MATGLATLGCESLAGLNDFTDRPSTGGASAGGAGATGGVAGAGGVVLESCGESKVCVPPNPVDVEWEGPVVVVWGSEDAPPCEVWTDDQGIALADPAAAANSGTCSPCTGCGDPNGVSCPFPQYAVHTTNDCSAAPLVMATAQTTCSPIAGADGTISVATVPLEASGSCAQTAPPASFTATAPEFARYGRRCAPAEAPTSSCSGDQLCLPDPGTGPDVNICIWREGTADECPPPYGGSKMVFAAGAGGWDDGRECAPCTCSFKGNFCTGLLTVWGAAGCSGAAVGTTYGDAPTCTGLNEWAFHTASLVPANPPGTCEAAGGEPTGAVSITAEHTLCCL